jgi:predicted nucleic acid-binding protein
VARRAGKYRYDLARRGVQISATDALIAAVARDRAAVLVTRNVRDFPMADIHVLSL